MRKEIELKSNGVAKPSGLKTLEFPAEFKMTGEDGSFEGMASVYSNVDLGDDIIVPGAFKEFAFTKDQQIRILDNHQMRVPIGKGKLTDTHVGLAIAGKLNLALPAARIQYELMKDGIVDGLSVGFDILPGGSKIDDKGIRMLESLKLWEVSTTAFPMNQSARISAVKSIPQFDTIRECERWLRDEVNFTREGAKEFVARFKEALVGARDEPHRDGASQDGDLADALKFLEKFPSTL